jgi:hypothetical protein
MKTLRFADLKHKMSPARRAEIARAAKAEVAPAMTNERMERLKAKGWRSGSAADFLTPQLVEARYLRDFVIWLRFAELGLRPREETTSTETPSKALSSSTN